ncbi:hypothetical protein [Amycolatopsis kentuckyensis]|uniref:hypothetical protein n=1 Tax=Amycolatopsis kentuckyensis TaxID=218823 RepID=UPI0013028F84|nr:hypothetical protein [Amycolatopsis kentuckyensis]
MRQLFRILVTGRRASYAAGIAAERRAFADFDQYESLRISSERELESYFAAR